MPVNHYESRKRWNTANYKQINIAVPPTLAESFRVTCEKNRIPMREALIEFITTYTATAPAPRKQSNKGYTERRGRRKSVAAIINQLEMIRDAEDVYKENMPENLKNSSRHEVAEHAVSALDEAIEILMEVFA